jgi:hypothetical protein
MKKKGVKILVAQASKKKKNKKGSIMQVLSEKM